MFNPAVAGPGVHVIRNTLGCGSDSISIIVSACAPLSVCMENNGNLTASNGVGTYTWYQQVQTQDCSACLIGCLFPPGCATTVSAWQSFATGSSVTPPGTYPLRVVDEYGTELILTSAGSIPACSACALTANASSTNSTCGNNGGTATAVASGATPTGYSWSNGASTASISNLSAGTYTVTITSTGCTATASTTVSSTGSVSANATSTSTSCNASNGSATVNASGGTGSFSYLWSNGGTTATVSNLAAGNYTVTVTSGSCTTTASVAVSSPNAVNTSASSTNVDCSSNGSASVSPTGGTGSFTYLWSNGANTSSVSNLTPGTYTVTVSSGGCTATASVSITQTGSVSASTSTTNAGCTTTGSATVNPTGGTGNYVYLWSTGATSATASNLSGGTYNVTVTSGNCSVTASASVVSTGGVTLSTSTQNTTCGNPNGSASVSPTTGSTPFTYLWSNGGTSSSISNVAAGTYTVSVNDGSGCSATAQAIVGSSVVTPALITTNDSLICSSDSTQICVSGNYTSYQWNTGQTTQCIYAKLAGNYYVTVTDNSSCTASSNRIPISVYPLPPVSISVNGDTLTAYNAVTYQWFLNNVPIAGATNSVYIAQQSGNYTVAVTDSNGCRAVSTKVSIVTTDVSDAIAMQYGLKVYPNPLESGRWTIEVDETLLGAKAEVFDNNGRLVYVATIKNMKSEIEFDVASGVYMLRLSSNHASITRKLIKL